MNPERDPKVVLLKLASDWGYNEASNREKAPTPLQLLHAELVAAITAGQPTDGLWTRYFDASEPLVDFADESKRTYRARAARDMVLGVIFYEAGEQVDALTQLYGAREAVRNGTTTAYHQPDDLNAAELAIINAMISSFGGLATHCQATAAYEESLHQVAAARANYNEAIAIYAEADDDPDVGTDQLGIIVLRVAQCYYGLHRMGGSAKQPLHWLEDRIIDAINRSFGLLAGRPEAARHNAFLVQLKGEAWWNAAVAR